jgi:colanic acid/amylovoran biosynthesis protein
MKKLAQSADPTFLLYGIGGLYNYGCEAVVRGTLSILRQEWPNCRIRYASRRPRQEARVLADCAVEVVDGRRPGWVRKLGGGMERIGFRYPLGPQLIELIKRSDCVLSIGGDLYTLPPTFSERSRFHSFLVDFGEKVMKLGKAFVVWGASIGPFESWPAARRAYRHHLQRVSLITVREPLTMEYLRTLGVSGNVRFAADPAFAVPYVDSEASSRYFTSKRPTVAINFSPLSLRYSSGKTSVGAYQAIQSEIVSHLLRELNINVLLVPHVVCPWDALDDDYRYLAALAERYAGQERQRLALLPSSLGAVTTKAVLSKCAVVIAARMHCAIAAISSGVPTIFVSYSSKAVGMAKYAYGDTKWVMPLKGMISQHIFEKTRSILANQETFRRYLSGALARFRTDAFRGGEALKRALLATL